MSSPLPYPRSPASTPDSMQQSVQDAVQLLRLVFFPNGGNGLMQRMERLEQSSGAATTTVGAPVVATTQRVWVDDGTPEEPGVLIIDEGVGA